MMKFAAALATAAMAMPAAAFAQSGDAEAGERVFRQCTACHVVENDAGETLAGRAAMVGPNLYQISGRPAGAQEGFNYSDALAEAGEDGLVWDEEAFVAYVQDPTGYLREYLGDDSARGNMAYQVRRESDANDVYAYLVSLE